MKRILPFVLLSAIACASSFGFSEKDIISPAAGKWCNKQALVINQAGAGEIYYSLSGSDPFESGFAYDGPALIEKNGNVEVRIGIVEGNGDRKVFSVSYNVSPADCSVHDETSRSFIDDVLMKSPLVAYRCGEKFCVPDGFLFSFDNGRKPLLKKGFSTESQNSLERFVPFVVSDGTNSWHSVIHIIPSEKKQVFESVELPYEIREWSNFEFKDKSYIYQIDDEMWCSDYSPRTLDRNVSHTLRFQPVEFSEGNKVSVSVIPEMPVAKKSTGTGGMVFFSLDEDSRYVFENGKKKIAIQTFEGEEAEGTFEPGVYLNGNLHGKLSLSYFIDRLAPVEPVITVSRKSSGSRSSIAFSIACSEKASVFYAVSEPEFFDDDYEKIDLEKISCPENFIQYEVGEHVVESFSEKAAIYKVYAYSLDDAGNKSDVVESVIVADEVNFYLSSAENPNRKADGSYMNPFGSFEQALKVINGSGKETKLHVDGDIVLSGGKYSIARNCRIYGNGSRFILEKNASISIKDSTVSFEKCIIEKTGSTLQDSVAFDVLDSTISFSECEMVGIFNREGKFMNSSRSNVILKNSGLTVQSKDASICVYASGGSLSVMGSRLTAIGDSSVNVDAYGIEGFFGDSSFTSIGTICIGIGLKKSSAEFKKTEFVAQSDEKLKSSVPVKAVSCTSITGLADITCKGY